jgi:hypothetical protein
MTTTYATQSASNDPEPIKTIPWVQTNTDRSTAALIACELEAHRRKRNQFDASRPPAGLIVGEASAEDWAKAVAEFRV